MRALLPTRLLLLCLCLLSSLPARAHSMYQAAVLLDVHAHSVDAEWQLPSSRLEKVLGAPVTATSLHANQSVLANYVLSRTQLQSSQGAPWTVALQGPLVWRVLDGAPYVVAHLHLQPPPGASARVFVLQSRVLTDVVAHQVVLVSIRSDWNSSTFASEPEMIGILTADEASISIDRSYGGWTKGFRSIFHLGVRHIAEGTDHLLFLLALLLPAPLLYRAGRWTTFAGVRQGLTQILKVVTAFTLGHSITLAFAATGLVRVPGRPIEILIAVSILISAIHAIKPLFPGKEAMIAAAFGLVHGLAFATTLAELGLRGWERAASILAFNFGIEAMQLVVVLCIMPSLMLLSRTRVYGPFRVIGALFAGTAACGWVVERTTSRSLQVDRVVDAVSKHSVLLALSLLLLALTANLLPNRPEGLTIKRQHLRYSKCTRQTCTFLARSAIQKLAKPFQQRRVHPNDVEPHR